MNVIVHVPAGTPIPAQYQNASVRRGRHKVVSSRDRYVVVDDEGNYSYPEASKVDVSPDMDSPPVVHQREFDRYNDTAALTANRPLTEPEIFDLWALDPEIWQIQKLVTNTWSTQWQTKAWLERNNKNFAASVLWEEMLADLRSASPERSYTGWSDPAGAPRLGLMAIHDVHLGMLAWGPETGYENWDLGLGAAAYRRAFEDLFDRMGRHDLEHIVFVVGNDFFHVDSLLEGKSPATTRGTVQDVDGRWQKAFVTGRDLMVESIDNLLAFGCAVTVVVVPGNHDKERAWMLGEVLDAWYHNDERVMIDNRPLGRKYLRYGENLLGFHHGDRVKPEQLYRWMSQESEDWSDVVHREWILGDKHHDRIERVDNLGIRIRTIPSIIPPDNWHSESGFVGSSRGAKALIYDPQGGVDTEYTHHVRGDKDGSL